MDYRAHAARWKGDLITEHISTTGSQNAWHFMPRNSEKEQGAAIVTPRHNIAEGASSDPAGRDRFEKKKRRRDSVLLS